MIKGDNMKRILIVLIVMGLMLTGCFFKKKEETEPDASEILVPEETKGSASEEVFSEDEKEPEDAVIILDSEGDVEIVIPDDQESAGE